MKIFPTLFTFLLACVFPTFAHAAGPTITLSLGESEVSIKNDNSTETLEFENTYDLQAMRIERNGKYYVAVLHFKKDVARLYVYNTNGKKLSSEKVLKAKDAKDFTTIRMRAKTIDEKERIRIEAIKTDDTAQPVTYIQKYFRVDPSKDDPITQKDSIKKDITYPHISSMNDAEAGMALFNYYRQSSGLLPLDRYSELDTACYTHAQYMKTNNILEHSEDPSLPGYTEEGDTAGRSSNITRQIDSSMVRAVKTLMNGTYHRILMMVNGLHGTGFGIAGPSSSNYYFSCLNIYTAVDGYTISGADTNVTYYEESNMNYILTPGPGEDNVPTTMNAGEWPDPLYTFNGEYPAGYPVTVTFGSRDAYVDVKLKLLHPNGEEISTYFQPPGDQNDPNVLYQNSAYSLIPISPLANKTTYTVQLTGKRNGEPYTFSWHFTTE